MAVIINSTTNHNLSFNALTSTIPAYTTEIQTPSILDGLSTNYYSTFKTISAATTETTLQQHQNNTNNATPNDLIHNEFVQIFFCILYTTVFVLGVFGNVLVCYVVLRNRAMQTVTNIFITNLALSDILLCVLAVPFTPLYTFMGRWAFGKTLCHLVSFAQGCSIYISTLTLTSIAIDRYFVIIYPFHPRMKLSTCILIIVSIWIVSLLATLPYGMYMKVVTDANFESHTNNTITSHQNESASQNNSIWQSTTPSVTLAAEAYKQVLTPTPIPTLATSTSTYCEENWPSEQYRKVFGSVTTIFQFVLPFIIISICYTWVSIKLNARARAKPGSKSSRREEADRDRKKRTNRMLISMVGVFGLSWLPINVVNILNDFYENSNDWPYYILFFFVAHSIAMSSTCYNPFLYAWLNDNFRKEFKHVLPCFNPSNNNIINITRGFNRSDRNTCGPRLHRGNGTGGSMDGDDQDENGITEQTSIPKEKLLIIPREPTYGNGSGSTGPLSPHCLITVNDVNSALVHNNRQVDILLNDTNLKRTRRITDEEGDVDSGDEHTVEVRFCETPFISSSENTGISCMETSTSDERGNGGSHAARKLN